MPPPTMVTPEGARIYMESYFDDEAGTFTVTLLGRAEDYNDVVEDLTKICVRLRAGFGV